MEEEKQCILVIVGATDKGQKELIAIADGYRESEQSWLEVLLDLKRRGLEMGRNWRSATARSASGRRSAKSTQAPASNAAGFTRRATS